MYSFNFDSGKLETFARSLVFEDNSQYCKFRLANNGKLMFSIEHVNIMA